MKTRLFLAATLLVPAISQAEPFTGPYAGVYAGYDRADDKGTGHDQGTGAINGWAQKTKPDGAQYGILGGYNWRLGSNYLIGLEGDVEGRGGNNDRSFQNHNGITDTDFTESTKLRSAASLRARIGYVFDNRAAVYATAGYASASVKRTYQTVGAVTESHSGRQSGWTAGVGADYLLTGQLAARLEYRHTDYGTDKVSADLWGEFYKQRLTEDSLRIGLTYQF